MAKRYANFREFFGLEDANTQELQEEISAVINPEDTATVIDKLEETYEVGDTERNSGDVDYMPEELKAEIEAIEKAADLGINEGAEVMTMQGDDPYHEEMGGVDLANDTEEKVEGFDEVQEYAASVNEVQITGNSPNLDEFLREEYDQAEEDSESGITAPGENEATLDEGSVELNPNPEVRDINSLQADEEDEDVEETEVSVDDVTEENHEDALDISDVTGTESEDFESDDDEEEESEEAEEEIEEEIDEEVDEDETEEVESDEAEDVEEEEEVSEEVEVEESGDDEEIPEDTCCAEEYAMLGELDNIELNDNPVVSEDKMEELQQQAEETQLGDDSAFAEVSEMQDVNPVDGETPEPLTLDGETEIETATIDDDTLMSDIVGDMVAEDSHGEDDAYYDGDIAADGDGYVSEGEASYDEGGEDDYSEDEDVEADVEIDEDSADVDGDGDIDADDVEDMAPDEDDAEETEEIEDAETEVEDSDDEDSDDDDEEEEELED